MARSKSTTKRPFTRCPDCKFALLVYQRERACEQCGWHTPGFENVGIRTTATLREEIDRVEKLLKRGALPKLKPGVAGRVIAFRRKFLKPAALETCAAPEIPAAQQRLRRRGGRTPDPDREEARQLIRAVLQRHLDRVLAREITIKAVADELISEGQECWSEDGWYSGAARNLISEEMITFRKSQ